MIEFNHIIIKENLYIATFLNILDTVIHRSEVYANITSKSHTEQLKTHKNWLKGQNFSLTVSKIS